MSPTSSKRASHAQLLCNLLVARNIVWPIYAHMPNLVHSYRSTFWLGPASPYTKTSQKRWSNMGSWMPAYKTGILRRKTRASLLTFLKPLPLLQETIMEGFCWLCITGFFVNAQLMPQLIAKGLGFAQGGCMGETDPYSKSPLVKKFAWGNDFAYNGVYGDSVIAACFISKSNDPMENLDAADRYRRCVYLNIRYEMW